MPTDAGDQFRLTFAADNLLGYLETAGVRLADHPDPMPGQWDMTGDGSYLVFGRGEFTWYQSAQVTDDNYYHGVYVTIPACELNSGISLTRGSQPCYTVEMRYTDKIVGGVVNTNVAYGAFVLITVSADEFTGMNMRTGNDIRLMRH